MSKINDFKSIADEVMNDINMSEELKEKTLIRCTKKRQVPISKFLIPAACLLLIFGMMNIFGLLPSKTQLGKEENTQFNIMAGTGEGIVTLPGQLDPETGKDKNWLLNTQEEAKKSFGSFFLTPSYITGSFKLDKIHASGTDQPTATKIVLEYFTSDKSFLIIQEKSELQNGFVNFKTIDINGTSGYLKPSVSDDDANAEVQDTEVHWFKDGVHYSVMGLITEDEAIKVAISMK